MTLSVPPWRFHLYKNAPWTELAREGKDPRRGNARVSLSENYFAATAP